MKCRANRIGLKKEPLVLGPVLSVDPEAEWFIGTFCTFGDQANALVSRDHREPFVVRDEV